MLTYGEIFRRAVEGEPLPQDAFPQPTAEQIDDLQEFEPALLNRLIDSEEGGQDSVDSALAELRKKAEQHGWYPVVSVLCMRFSRRYHEDVVPENLQVSDGTLDLLRMLAVAGRAMEHDEGAWKIPFAILADLGEEEALTFTVCAAMCAAVGFIESTLEQEAQT